MVMWEETGVASNNNTEATVSETEIKKGKMGHSVSDQPMVCESPLRFR